MGGRQLTDGEVIRRCGAIITDAGLEDTAVNATNFLDYANLVRDIVLEWPSERRQSPDTLEFGEGLRRLRDDFEVRVAADPMVLYKPAHKAALEFHQGRGLVRYFRAPNRTSKTQSGVADNYWVATGQHPWRARCPLPSAVGIVGTNFSKYAPKVFEPKYLSGEPGNPLSPVFPDGGKWFHRYDKRKHIIELACPDCAEAGKAGSCKHPKSTVILFSDMEGPLVMAGGQYGQLQFDEQISEEFFSEGLKRLETVPHSGLIVTETPLGGKGFWTHKILTRDAKAAKVVPGTDQPLVELFTIDQFSAGLSERSRIEASMALMSPAEVEARVYGRPAAFSATGVFDSFELSEMNDEVVAPRFGELTFPEEAEKTTEEVLFWLKPGARPTFEPCKQSHLRVWHEPDPLGQYVIGADVAQGLIDGDASCASVLRMRHHGYDLTFELVAQLHGWINPRVYASACMKLALWYNEAVLVPERRGPGDEMIRSLKEFGYWNLFRDVTDPAQSEYVADPIMGLDTNVRTKSHMVAVLQNTIKDRVTNRRTIKIPCEDTIEELGCYAQKTTDMGTVRFGGQSGMHDDRVMSLVMGVYAGKVHGVYDHQLDIRHAREAAMESLSQQDRELWKGFRAEQARAAQQRDADV